MDAVAFHDATLPELIEFLLRRDCSAVSLAVCGGRSVFLQAFLSSFQAHQQRPSNFGNDNVGQDHQAELGGKSEVVIKEGQENNTVKAKHERNDLELSQSNILVPPLALLLASRHVKVVFCSSINSLRAHLSTLDPRGGASGLKKPALVLIGVVELHRSTGLFSVQALSRTLAVASEAAIRVGQCLFIAELSKTNQDLCESVTEANEPVGSLEVGPQERRQSVHKLSLWDISIPILDTASSSSQRPLHSVKIRDVVERWCHFEELPVSK